MIGTIDIEIQAANPQMPLVPIRAFVNSPTSVRVRNVPKAIGNWKITSVQIVALYPNNATKTANCVLVGGVWVGTIEGCAISGKSENGFTVFASGIDENGNPVSNYVLGKGLIEILQADGTITPDAPSYYVHLYDEEPTTPKEGDMYPTSDGYVIWQDGEAHGLGLNEEAIVGIIQETVPSLIPSNVSSFNNDAGYVTASAVSASYATKEDATLYLRGSNHDGFTDWTVEGVQDDLTWDLHYQPAQSGWIIQTWDSQGHNADTIFCEAPISATALTFDVGGSHYYSATREHLYGYILGSQTDKILADAIQVSAIEDVIPTEATSSNQLADKAWVSANATALASSAYDLASSAYNLADGLGSQLYLTNEIVGSNTNRIGTIEEVVPEQASDQNQLADKAFVNSSVQTATANFRGNWATWNDVPTNANDYPVDYAGNKTPTVNDYMVVQDVVVEGNEGTWRYKYSGTWATDGKNGWLPEYQVNEMPLTAAQLAAINSNITATKVAYYDSTLDGLEELIESI